MSSAEAQIEELKRRIEEQDELLRLQAELTKKQQRIAEQADAQTAAVASTLARVESAGLLSGGSHDGTGGMPGMSFAPTGFAPHESEYPEVSELLAWLRAPEEEDRLEALFRLSDIVNESMGEKGVRLGNVFRREGGLSQIIWMLADQEASLETHQQALLLLGNMCADAVDANSHLSKRLLLQAGSERVLFSFLKSTDDFCLMFVCGCIQNLCHDVAWSQRAVKHHVDHKLRGLLSHTDETVVSAVQPPARARALRASSTTATAAAPPVASPPPPLPQRR